MRGWLDDMEESFDEADASGTDVVTRAMDVDGSNVDDGRGLDITDRNPSPTSR